MRPSDKTIEQPGEASRQPMADIEALIMMGFISAEQASPSTALQAI
ncbi:MAG: hypothetical protein ACFC03_00200 [Candidatus Malihini olakiniferum]